MPRWRSHSRRTQREASRGQCRASMRMKSLPSPWALAKGTGAVKALLLLALAEDGPRRERGQGQGLVLEPGRQPVLPAVGRAEDAALRGQEGLGARGGGGKEYSQGRDATE